MKELEVRYGQECVGHLQQEPRGRIYFQYDPGWAAGHRELSPVYLPCRTRGAVATPTPGAGELHGLFQDALPDWWGEQMMRRYFTEMGIPWGKVTALQKLACQGDRKMGALDFLPVLDRGDFNDDLLVELTALVDAAREAIRGETEEVMTELVRSGISPGGARPKALLWRSPQGGQWHVNEAPGLEAWLVKFDTDPDTREGMIEQAYTRMAAAMGIQVVETRLEESSGAWHFLSRRFDRTPEGGRLHLHSFSGLTHTPVRDGIDYGDLILLARELTGDQRTAEQIFRRAVFNILAGNDDDHGRNHAFLMDDRGKWRLSPAFDLTQATNPLTSGFRAGRIQGKAAGITRRDLLSFAGEYGVGNAAGILKEAAEALAGWEDYAREARLPAGTARLAASQMPGLPE